MRVVLLFVLLGGLIVFYVLVIAQGKT